MVKFQALTRIIAYLCGEGCYNITNLEVRDGQIIAYLCGEGCYNRGLMFLNSLSIIAYLCGEGCYNVRASILCRA